VLSDGSTGRDLVFLLLHPIIGTVLAGAPIAALVVAVLAGADGAWLIAALAAGAFGVLVALAPMSLRAYGLWCRRLLGPVPESRRRRIDALRCWFGVRVIAFVRLVALGATGVAAGVIGVLTIPLLGIGWIFVLQPRANVVRMLATFRRGLAGEWSGVEIASPYRAPRPLDREPDGRYRVGRDLFKTVRWARWAEQQDRVVREAATWRDLAWALREPFTGAVLALLPAALIVGGVGEFIAPTIAGLAGGSGDPWIGSSTSAFFGDSVGWSIVRLLIGVVMIAVGVASTTRLLRWHGEWTAVLLSPTRGAILAQRVDELGRARADVVEDRAADIRRIERDLHDGAQARLVALGLTLGAVEAIVDTDPAAAKRLVTQARETSATALTELRDLVRGIRPPVLAERGLGDAVRALALNAPIDVDVTTDIPGRATDAVESAAYFAVAEALANAVKHAAATRIAIDIRWADGLLRVVVEDNGRGGADASRGSGLAGMTRRLGALDGTVSLASPAGGPTVLTMELPCVLSSPKTSLS
jgi:signal transduction histidine kinase